MKHYFIFFASLLILGICSCESPKPKTFADAAAECRQAINSNDFGRARAIVDSLANTFDRDQAADLKKEVVKKEILYIFTEMTDEDMLNAKILTFLEEDSTYAADALRIAQNAKKTAIAKSIVETYFFGKADLSIIKFFQENDVDFLITYVKSLSEMDEDLIKKLLGTDNKEVKNVVINYLRNKYIVSSSSMNDDLIKHLLDSEDKEINRIAFDYLRNNKDFSSDILNSLAKQCNKRYNSLLIDYLSKKSSDISGKSLKAGIHHSDSKYLSSEYDDYIRTVEIYNGHCRKMIDCAISNHNLALAQETIRMFRKNMHAKDLGAYKTWTEKRKVTKYVDDSGLFGKGVSKLFGDSYESTEKVTYTKNKYKITWDWVDRDEAKSVLKSAQNERAFKK